MGDGSLAIVILEQRLLSTTGSTYLARNPSTVAGGGKFSVTLKLHHQVKRFELILVQISLPSNY